MPQRCILWDFDGTLARRPSQWSGALLEALSRFEPAAVCELSQLRPHLQSGFPWHHPERGHVHLATADAWWAEIYPILERALSSIGLSASRAAEIARATRPAYLDASRWEVFEDSLPTLAVLAEAGWSHAILSNHVPELVSLVASLGLAENFAAVHSSAILGFEKPNPLAFRRTREFLGDPRQLWMVGDSYTADVLGAENVGIPAILVRSRHESARYQCASLSEVAHIVGA